MQNTYTRNTNTRMRQYKKRMKKYWPLLILLMPAFIYVLIFNYQPMYGIIIAFKNFKVKKGYWGSDWIGFEHFIRFFTYPKFWTLIRNTLGISLYSLATFPCALILALLMNEITKMWFKKTVQMVTYAPYFLSVVVLCGMIKLFCGGEGLLRHAYRSVTGVDADLLTLPHLFRHIYIWSGVWKGVGWGTIIYMSALSGVPPELVEAARIDGASRTQVIWHVNLPHIIPAVVIMLVLDTGSILSVGYEKILLLQNDLNLDVSTVISTYTYKVGIEDGKFAYSTAIGLFNNVVNIIMIIISNYVANRISGSGLF